MLTPLRSRWFVASLAVVTLATGLAWKISSRPAAQMRTFAAFFLSTLDDEKRAVAVHPFEAQDRVAWHFIPMKERKGLMLEQMNDSQRTAALRLLRSALSQAGYTKASRIMLLEEVLRELEAGKGAWERNPLRYYVTIFGDPTAASEGDEPSPRWGLSFEGHHLSLNFVCRGDEVVDSTPQFMAANPAVVMNETTATLGKGTRVLRLEEQLAFKLINSLTSQQQSQAIIAAEAPPEIRFAGEAQPVIGPSEGITHQKMGPAQRALLEELVGLYTDVAPEEVSDRRRAQIDADAWGDVAFAWAGATEPGIGHYYRIQGTRFLIEFVNTQADPLGNPANHIHCVLRDLEGDFDLPISR